jgi:hypothetical protein
MIMEDFVPFEIAKKLKEKGFDYPCAGHYVNNQLYIAHYQNAFHSDKDESIDAPTISQTLKWLREEKNIILTPNPSYFKEDCCLGWDCDVWASGNYDYCCVDYKTYEQASIAGFEYVLDNLI